MAVSTANTSIKLGVDSPKKDATIETLGMTACTAREVGIWAGSNINTGLVQSIVGTFEVLKRYALNYLKETADGAPIAETIFHVDLGGTEANVVVDGVPTVDQCRLHVGVDIINKELSHFLDRTHKRLVERWLEEN